jgi:hypothetical protein
MMRAVRNGSGLGGHTPLAQLQDAEMPSRLFCRLWIVA